MLKILLKLKDFCREMSITNFKKLNMAEPEWQKVSDIIQALEPVRKYTLRLQYELLSLSGFYGYWQECKVVTEKKVKGGSVLAKLITNNKSREFYWTMTLYQLQYSLILTKIRIELLELNPILKKFG